MSNFKNILKSHKESQEPQVEEPSPPSPAPPAQSKIEAVPKVSRSASKGDEPKKKRGRPNGKRSDSEYNQVTAYIRSDTHKSVKKILLDGDGGKDFSDLVEELLAKWLRSRT